MGWSSTQGFLVIRKKKKGHFCWWNHHFPNGKPWVNLHFPTVPEAKSSTKPGRALELLEFEVFSASATPQPRRSKRWARTSTGTITRLRKTSYDSWKIPQVVLALPDSDGLLVIGNAIWLVVSNVSIYPSEKYDESSVGMMKFTHKKMEK